MSGCRAETFVDKAFARVRKIEWAYALFGSMSEESERGEQTRSNLVVSRMTSVSNNDCCIHNLANKAKTCQYLARSEPDSRGGASSGRALKRIGRVVSVTCRGAEEDIDESRSIRESLLKIFIRNYFRAVVKYMDLVSSESSSSCRTSFTLCTMNPSSSSVSKRSVCTILLRPSSAGRREDELLSPTVKTPRISSL
jgi:hypothetical protein